MEGRSRRAAWDGGKAGAGAAAGKSGGSKAAALLWSVSCQTAWAACETTDEFLMSMSLFWLLFEGVSLYPVSNQNIMYSLKSELEYEHVALQGLKSTSRIM